MREQGIGVQRGQGWSVGWVGRRGCGGGCRQGGVMVGCGGKRGVGWSVCDKEIEFGRVRSMMGEEGGVVVGVRHVQLSCMVWHMKLAGAGMWVVQCLWRVLRNWWRSAVMRVWVTVRSVVQRVEIRCSSGVRAEGRCVRSHA
jgi:hypothetical protein